MTEQQNPTHKICSHCGQLKPLGHFLRRTGKGARRNARRGACKACRKQRGDDAATAAPAAGVPAAAAEPGAASPSAAAPAAAPAPGAAHAAARRQAAASRADAPDGAPQAPPAEQRPAAKRSRRRRAKKAEPQTPAPQASAPQAPAQPSVASGPLPLDEPQAPLPRRPLARRPLPTPPPKPEGPDASVLRPTRQGVIRMRGKTDKGKRWLQETDLDTAVTLVRERAAVVVNRNTIRRLYSNKAFRRYILTRDRYTCYFCGEYGDTIDHLLPRAKGGHTTPMNCVCACNLCNQSKADQSLDEFMADESPLS